MLYLYCTKIFLPNLVDLPLSCEVVRIVTTQEIMLRKFPRNTQTFRLFSAIRTVDKKRYGFLFSSHISLFETVIFALRVAFARLNRFVASNNEI